MLNNTNFTKANGFVSDDDLIELADDPQGGQAGTTTIPCAIGGGIIAASAALPDFCPSGACTTRC